MNFFALLTAYTHNCKTFSILTIQLHVSLIKAHKLLQDFGNLFPISSECIMQRNKSNLTHYLENLG
jgi:hypothetical protein